MYLTYSIPYIVFCLFIYLFSFELLPQTKSNIESIKNHKLIQYIMLFFTFMFFIGFRGYIWTDFALYKQYFDAMPTFLSSKIEYSNFNNLGISWEPGYYIYIYLMKSIFHNYFVVQFVTTLLTFKIMYWFFKKNCSNILLCFVIFFLFNGFFILFNLQRNVISILLFWISLEKKRECKNLQYYALNLLGISFHTSAIIFLLLGPFINKRFTKKCILLVFIIGNIIYLLQVQYLKMFLLALVPLLPRRIALLIEFYFSNSAFSGSGNYGISIGYLERTLSFLLVWYYSDRLDDKYHCRCYINCFYLFIFSYLFGSEIFIVIQRFVTLFTCGYCIMYPQMLTFWNKDKKLIFYLVFAFYLLLKIMSIGSNNEMCKYETCFSNTTFEEAKNKRYKLQRKTMEKTLNEN